MRGERAKLPISADGFESGDLCLWSTFVGTVNPPPDCPPPPQPDFVRATYSSDGLLHTLTRSGAPEQVLYFYFYGRPVAQLEIDGPNETFKWITTDHLGTPVMLTDAAGTRLWTAGFEPFGADYENAAAQNLFLRFSGQWEEGVWDEASVGAGVYQNLHRWYLFGDGRYGSADPLGLSGDPHPYIYSQGNPVRFTDRTRLASLTRKPSRYEPRAWKQMECQGLFSKLGLLLPPLGCTLVHLNVTCSCQCQSDGWAPSVSITLGTDVYFASNSPVASPELIQSEENKHVGAAEHFAQTLYAAALELEQRRFSNRLACAAACRTFEFGSAIAAQYYDQVHERNPHPY